MTSDFPGSGDRARSRALLWRPTSPDNRRPGPRSALDVDRIVGAAVELADAHGLPALSMRRVANQLGVAVMTLYGHVPGKGELVDLMLDAVLAELYADAEQVTSGNWRARLAAVARANRALLLRHSWAAQVAAGDPTPGPQLTRKYEVELRAVDGLGLSEVQMDLLVSLLNGFVRGSAGGHGPVLTELTADIEVARFPTAARVGPIARAQFARTSAAEQLFEFGLERLLDGIGVLILDPSR
jgi:AcrR family transcriptional regulator